MCLLNIKIHINFKYNLYKISYKRFENNFCPSLSLVSTNIIIHGLIVWIEISCNWQGRLSKYFIIGFPNHI
jgi:hypothetical protein